ncbi:MAG: 6-phosphogluconolactonase, partial [Elusimicrobia bacterium]|nr:6-phosphogluconolactonase [Elusimicrobiota bacterium]
MPDAAAVAEAAARLWSAAAAEAVARRGVFRAAISGGRTPAAFLRRLARARFRSLPWNKTELYWVDERCVPEDDPRSNYGLARAAFLRRVAPAKVFPMHAGRRGPDRGAAAYEALLRRRGIHRSGFDF